MSNYYGEMQKNQVACEVTGRPLDLKENLGYELQRAQANVARIQELLALLDKNPEVNRIMELLGKGY